MVVSGGVTTSGAGSVCAEPLLPPEHPIVAAAIKSINEQHIFRLQFFTGASWQRFISRR